MNLEERIALHRRMAEGYHDAYMRQDERGDAVYSEDWNFADDAVYSSQYFSGGKDVLIAEMMKSTGKDIHQGAKLEAKVYSDVLPDWKPVDFICFPSDIGFSMQTRFEGHTKDGIKMTFHALDYVLTDEDGLITRWETFVDGEEFGPLAELVLGVRGPFSDMTDYWRALYNRFKDLGLE